MVPLDTPTAESTPPPAETQVSLLDSLWRPNVTIEDKCRRGTWGYLSILDFVLSFILIMVAYYANYIIFLQPDGHIDEAWAQQSALAVASIVFGSISMCARIALLLAYFATDWCKCCNSPVVVVVGRVAQVHRRARTVLSVLYGTVTLFSLIATFMALDQYLAITVYHPASKFSFSNCDPMVPKACALPYPSSYCQVPDASTVTGVRLSIGEATLPYTTRGAALDTTALNSYDGFSVGGSLLWHLPVRLNETLVCFSN